MSTHSYTPGPWYVTREARNRLLIRTRAEQLPDGENIAICQVMAGAVGDAFAYGNALLIASAPAMAAEITRLRDALADAHALIEAFQVGEAPGPESVTEAEWLERR